MRRRMKPLAALTLASLLFSCSTEPARTFRGPGARRDALSSGVVISEVYAGGNAGGAVYRHDFVELLNRGTAAVDVTNWSVQYASQTGAGWQVATLGSFGLLQPGQRLLVRLGTAGSTGATLPTHDVSGGLSLSATAGKVALVNTSTGLTVACPTGANVIDLVGYGAGTNCSEGTLVPAPATDLSMQRRLQGCRETDDNAADFFIAAPTPQSSTDAVVNCATATDPDAGCRVITAWNTTRTEGSYDPPTSSTTAILSDSDGGEEDLLVLELYYPDGGLTLPTSETYTGTSTYGGCQTCAWIGTGCDPALGCQRFFFPQVGTALVTRADRDVTNGQLTGSLSGLTFVEWDFDLDVAVAGGGCIELAAQDVAASWGTGVPTGGGTGGGAATGGGSGTGGGMGGGAAAGGGGAAAGGGGGAATGGGTGAGGVDAGRPDAGVGGGSGSIGGKSGCGCTAGGEGSLALVLLGALLARRR
jgi:MYXO-CTERM domain-containing protein